MRGRGVKEIEKHCRAIGGKKREPASLLC